MHTGWDISQKKKKKKKREDIKIDNDELTIQLNWKKGNPTRGGY